MGRGSVEAKLCCHAAMVAKRGNAADVWCWLVAVGVCRALKHV